MQKRFIFDLDDTLIKNHHKYSYVQLEFFKLIAERLGHNAPDLQAIIELQTKIDTELVPKHGFSIERFPNSFRESYRVIAESLGFEDNKGAELAYQIGMKVFDESRWKVLGVGGLVHGAEETLDFLKEKGDELVLLTKGDERVQREKLDLYELRRWFGNYEEGKMHIVPIKDAAVIRQVAGDTPLNRVWHVGNLIKSDLIPGIEAGVGVIYIPCETWAYEKKHDGLPKHPRLRIFKDLGEFVKGYDSLK